MSIVKTVTITDNTKFGSITTTFYAATKLTSQHCVSAIKQVPSTARTNVILRGADGKFISYKNKNVEKSFRVAIENLIPFPKGV